MLLKRLEIRNMRKVKQADIDFYGSGLRFIQGKNKSGKSTIAQSIALTLEGPKSVNPGIITCGEEQAEVVAYTDDGLQIRTNVRKTEKGAVKQTVSRLDPAANRYVTVSGGVRAFLDSIRSGLEMPWALRDMTDAKIIEILKDRSGLTEKIAGIDADIRDKETARTETGRDKKRLGTMDPVKPVKHPDPINNIQTERTAAAAYLNKERNVLLTAADFIREKCVFNSIADIEKLTGVITETVKAAREHMKGDKVYTRADVEALEKEITTWVEEEQKAKKYDDYMEWKKKVDQLTADYESLGQEIEVLREKRKRTLAEMNLGVKGLEIGEDNMLYHNGTLRGITESNSIANWSTAESVQVFFSIGARFAGEMKVLVVDNAESLDSDTTKRISEWADKASFLVILLKVADVPEELEEGIIYLKEGEVVTA